MRTTLESQPGVQGVEVDFEGKTATIRAESAFDSEQALAALKEAGYPSTPR